MKLDQTLASRPPKLSGRDAEHPTKMPRQMALIGKAHRVGNLRQCEIGMSQHVACAFDPLLDEIVVRGNAGRLLEASREMMDRIANVTENHPLFENALLSSPHN